MDEQYFVAPAPGAGIIGTFTEREIRRRLAAGGLRPSDVCVPVTATGNIASQWQSLSTSFPPVPAVTLEDRVAVLESQLAGFRSPRLSLPVLGGLGTLLLVLGQIVSVIGCIVAFGCGVYTLGWVKEVRYGNQLLPIYLGVCGSALACGLWAALFVVFTRVKQLPPG